MMRGGLTEAKPATPEIQKLADQMKPLVEQKENQTYPVFRAIEYKTQVVAGTNYFIKVDIGKGDYIHLRIFQSLEAEGPSLSDFQTGKLASNPLD